MNPLQILEWHHQMGLMNIASGVAVVSQGVLCAQGSTDVAADKSGRGRARDRRSIRHPCRIIQGSAAGDGPAGIVRVRVSTPRQRGHAGTARRYSAHRRVVEWRASRDIRAS